MHLPKHLFPKQNQNEPLNRTRKQKQRTSCKSGSRNKVPTRNVINIKNDVKDMHFSKHPFHNKTPERTIESKTQQNKDELPANKVPEIKFLLEMS